MDLIPNCSITEWSFFCTSKGDLFGNRYASFNLDTFSVRVSNTALVHLGQTIKSAS